MSPQLMENLEKRMAHLYLAVKNNRPDLYERAVQIGHMATVQFGGADENKRAAVVEGCVIAVIVEALEL